MQTPPAATPQHAASHTPASTPIPQPSQAVFAHPGLLLAAADAGSSARTSVHLVSYSDQLPRHAHEVPYDSTPHGLVPSGMRAAHHSAGAAALAQAAARSSSGGPASPHSSIHTTPPADEAPSAEQLAAWAREEAFIGWPARWVTPASGAWRHVRVRGFPPLPAKERQCFQVFLESFNVTEGYFDPHLIVSAACQVQWGTASPVACLVDDDFASKLQSTGKLCPDSRVALCAALGMGAHLKDWQNLAATYISKALHLIEARWCQCNPLIVGTLALLGSHARFVQGDSLKAGAWCNAALFSARHCPLHPAVRLNMLVKQSMYVAMQATMPPAIKPAEQCVSERLADCIGFFCAEAVYGQRACKSLQDVDQVHAVLDEISGLLLQVPWVRREDYCAIVNASHVCYDMLWLAGSLLRLPPYEVHSARTVLEATHGAVVMPEDEKLGVARPLQGHLICLPALTQWVVAQIPQHLHSNMVRSLSMGVAAVAMHPVSCVHHAMRGVLRNCGALCLAFGDLASVHTALRCVQTAVIQCWVKTAQQMDFQAGSARSHSAGQLAALPLPREVLGRIAARFGSDSLPSISLVTAGMSPPHMASPAQTPASRMRFAPPSSAAEDLLSLRSASPASPLSFEDLLVDELWT